MCSKKQIIEERLCRHDTFCLFFNFVHGQPDLPIRDSSFLKVAHRRTYPVACRWGTNGTTAPCIQSKSDIQNVKLQI